MLASRDTLGRYAKFVAPTVVNGRVYVPTFSGQLAVYGLLSSGSPSSSEVKISAIANSASLLGDVIAPGEVVAIYGTNLGPPTAVQTEIDADGHVPNILAGTQVLFNGLPAPVLYTSIGEVGAMVPFGIDPWGINGLATQVQIVYDERWSQALPVPVVPADPALFAQDGTGGGPGSILNSDGTVNSFDNPAAPGSAIALLATGVGITTQPREDGKVPDDATPFTPALPITVLLDGQPSKILSVTSAPGMVQGFVQIKVKIPEMLPPSYDVHVMLKMGMYTSPTTVTLSVQ